MNIAHALRRIGEVHDGAAVLNCVDMSRWGGELTTDEATCLISKGVKRGIFGVGNPNGSGLFARQQSSAWQVAGGQDQWAYIYLNFGDDAETQVNTAFGVLAGNPVTEWCLDFEDVSPEALAMGPEATRAYLWKAIRAVEARGFDPIIYTGRWWWNPHVGDTLEFAAYRLWDSAYPDAATVDVAVIMPWPERQYGGFDVPIVFQYKGTSVVCGQSVDLNWATDLDGGDPTPTPPAPPAPDPGGTDVPDNDLRMLVVGNGLRCYPWEDTPGEDSVLHLFPTGTVPAKRTDPAPAWVMLTGDSAFEYARLRGFAFGLAGQENTSGLSELRSAVAKLSPKDMGPVLAGIAALEDAERALIASVRALQ